MADAIELRRLGEGPLSVQAGERVEVRLQVTNRRPAVDQFEARVEGLPPDWSSAVIAAVSLFPGEQGNLAVALHPPGGAETRAGRYPLRLGVLSRDDPTISTWLSFEVEVVPIGGIAAELRPELVEGRRGHFRVIVTNLGNHARRVALRASDPAQELAYRFERSEAELEPQEERVLALEVVPPRRPFAGPPLEHPFAVEAFDPDQADAPPLARLAGTYRYHPVLAQWPWARLPLWLQRALPFLALALAALGILLATRPVLAALGIDLPLFAAAPPAADQPPTATPTPTPAATPRAGSDRPPPGGAGGSGPAATPPPAPPPLVRLFDLELASDAPRGASTLTWRVEAADAVQLNGQPVAPAGAAPAGEGGEYLLQATNSSGTAQRSLVLQVVGPPIIKQFLPAAPVIGAGDQTELLWHVVGADAAEIEGAPIDVNAGRLEIQPDQNASYILTARNVAGQVSSYVAVTVVPDAELTFFVTPDAIEVGGKADLSWTSSYAFGLRIDPDIGSVRSNGSRGVAPKETTTYQLTGKNALGKEATASVTLQVSARPPVVGTFRASPSSITRGASSTLTWAVTGARSVTIQPGIGAVGASGSRGVSPQSTTTYTLVATNEGGSVSASAAVGVGEVPPPVITRFSVSPDTVTTGTSIKLSLSWATSGASTRTITWEDSGGKKSAPANPASGSTGVDAVQTKAGTLVFTLTATGAGGQSTTASEKVVVVDPVSIQRFISSRSCAGASFGPERVTLTWAASGGSDATVQLQRRYVEETTTTTVFTGGTGDLNRSFSERPPFTGSYIYTLTVRNAAGMTATRSLSVPVSGCIG